MDSIIFDDLDFTEIEREWAAEQAAQELKLRQQLQQAALRQLLQLDDFDYRVDLYRRAIGA